MPNKVIVEPYDIRKYVDTFVYFIESPLCPQSPKPIYIFSQSQTLTAPVNSIVFNIEQLSRPNILLNILNYIKRSKGLEIWDYSLANVNILKKHNILAKHVPLESPDWYIKELQSYRKKNMIYDVGFSGYISPRRLKIFNKLKELGISVNIIKNVFGKRRDKELAKCKLLLNIHASPYYKIFESNRCEPWLKAGVTVISENSLDNDERCINVKYSDIIKTVELTLSIMNSLKPDSI